MDYADLKLTADSLIVDAKQGTIEVGTSIKFDGLTPLDAPTVTTVWEEFSGVVRGISSKYVDNETILTTDLMAIMEADATPSVGGLMRVDSVVKKVVRIDNIPSAGITVAKRVFIR